MTPDEFGTYKRRWNTTTWLIIAAVLVAGVAIAIAKLA
jgi:hypothetical protein